MKDILRELQSLSLKLQRREMTLVDSSVHIKQTINVLTAMKTTGGRSTKKAEQGVSSGFFKDVELTEGRGKINKPRFYESVVATLTKRLPDCETAEHPAAVKAEGQGESYLLLKPHAACSLRPGPSQRA
ncbi:hypothetical protein JOQ06_028932 [Pogonophryne albipinna]|uniref:Uncharacterized protein n=1 Tax=Pogonophryne albipinna TaxID=1090488 RepID=A0AAD6B905_9TELE|nr:hypothetical protein JOQ06_028932 [Pogonophryne albipinna]